VSESAADAGIEIEKARETTLDEYHLRPILLTDPSFVTTPSQVLNDLTINLHRVRTFTPLDEKDNPFMILKRDKDAPFVFGDLSFEIVTAKTKGRTALGLSFWDLTLGKPIEELVIPLCIGESARDCGSTPESRVSLRGIGIVDLESEKVTGLSTAAVHIVELSRDWVVGIFARNFQPNFEHRIWTVSKNADDFVTHLRELQKNFGHSTKDPVGVGAGIVNLLFPPRDDDAKSVRADFKAFVESHYGDHPFSKLDPPTLFVRTIIADLSQPALYPLGLLNFTNTEDGFVGFHFNIEIPLPKQSYGPSSDCVDTWRPLLPPSSAKGALADAHGKVADRIDVRIIGDGRVYRIAGRPRPTFSDMTTFTRWVGCHEEDPEATVISVISHHNENTLFFSDTSTVHAKNVAREFLKPSIAILSGCSTGEFGASGFVKNLNEAGIHAVIATNTGISGHLAGDFNSCLANIIDEAGGEIAIGTAFRHALRCLHEISREQAGRTESLYGPSVLSFTLAGNPNIALCTGETQ
jgi:hypothetical protein